MISLIDGRKENIFIIISLISWGLEAYTIADHES